MSIGAWIVISMFGGAGLAAFGWGFQRLVSKQDAELSAFVNRLERHDVMFDRLDEQLIDLKETITAQQYHQQLATQKLSQVIDQLGKSVEFLARRVGDRE